LALVQGGALAIRNVTVCVAQADLPLRPLVDTLAIYGDEDYRVFSVDGLNGNLWSITLIQQSA
jgi:hypothetical protein